MLFKLAWRNLWRNRRRSLITMGSVFFAVILSVFMRSMQIGSYDAMIENVAGFYTGYVQVHSEGYWDDQTIDNSFILNEDLRKEILQQKGVVSMAGRLENFALLSGDNQTKGGMIIGTEVEAEAALTSIDGRVIDGSYLKPNSKSILLAKDLASSLGLSVGDTVVILGQGYHAMSAAEKYPVDGILSFGSPELNKRLAYLPLSAAQELFSCEGRITSVVLGLEDKRHSAKVGRRLGAKLGNEYEVMDWVLLMPELKQALEADNASSVLFLGVLYLIIAFGIFGTVLMMLAERNYEFGVLTAIGMKRKKLAIVVVLETILISLGGAIIGMLVAFPVLYYFYLNPIRLTGAMAEAYIEFGFEPVMKFSMQGGIFYLQTLVVFCLALVISLYPLLKLRKLNTLDAMRG